MIERWIRESPLSYLRLKGLFLYNNLTTLVWVEKYLKINIMQVRLNKITKLNQNIFL